MHDWTMANAPTGTGNWFGWANAVVSELIPMAAALEIRRHRRNGRPAGYALAVMIGFALLSLAAQVAQAKASASGWLLAAVPAIGFLALTKMVLSRVPVVAVTAANALVTMAAPVAAQVAASMATHAATPPVTAPAMVPVTVADMPADTPRPPARTPRRTTAKPDTATAVAKLRAKHPDMSQDEMAARLAVAPRTVRRHLAAQRSDTPAPALQAA
ncbi:hypothetical protein R8Z50_31100 [Longispora sp. K20-0274]|uniref:hypothetical protein n=1 Tax=Longispora sp. K20-0274 TaxID=3088255 RepID=UPI00399AD2C3